MTITNITKKLTSMKFTTLAAAVLAVAALTASAPAAHAQHFAVQARVRGPFVVAPAPRAIYPAPVYVGPGYGYGYGYPAYRGYDRGFYGHDFDHRGFDRGYGRRDYRR